MNSHPNISDSLLFIGVGGNNPRVFALSSARHGQAFKQVADFKDRGHMLSVYGLALSPSQRYLAAGTRPILNNAGQVVHPSVLRVYPVYNEQEISLGPPVLDTFQIAGICGVDISDEGLLVGACGDGFLRIYSSLSNDRPLAEIKAHMGYVFAVCWVEPGKLLASYGQDGTLKIFEYPACVTLYSSPPCPIAANAALTSMALDRSLETLYYGCGSGHLHALRVQEGEARFVNAHPGGILAVAYHPIANKIITGGQQDGKICIWNPDDLSPAGDISVGTSILGIVPLAEDNVAIIDGGGSVSLYTLNPSITFVSQLAPLSARSWAGPDLTLLAKQRQASRVRDIMKIREKAIALIQKGHEEDVISEIRQLQSRGLGVDAMILHAALCRRLGMLLQEYQVWQDLRNQLGGKLPGNACYYLFAELLELIMEPRLAAEAFRKLGTYRDSTKRAERLENSPLYDGGIDSLVRCDFVKPEQMLEEVEKCNVFAKPFPWVVLMQGSRPEPMAYVPDLSIVARDLENRYDRRYGDWKILDEKRCFFRDGLLQNGRWLRVRLKEQGPPLGCLDVAVEIRNTQAGCQRISHVLFSPIRFISKDLDYKKWNSQVADWWKAIWSSNEAKNWADATHRVITSILMDAVHANQAKRDSGF